MNLLDLDLDEAESQYRRAVQQHQDNQIKLRTLQEERIKEIEDEWIKTATDLKYEFQKELVELENWFNVE